MHYQNLNQKSGFQVPESVTIYLNSKLQFQKRIALNRKLTKYIVGHLKPINTVREKYFREFCEEMNAQYVLPAAETVSNKLIPELDEKVMNEVREDFKRVKHVALTSDGWSSNVST